MSTDTHQKKACADEIGALPRRFDIAAIARFGGSPLRRTAVRPVAVQRRVPSHVFDAREEGVAAARALRDRGP